MPAVKFVVIFVIAILVSIAASEGKDYTLNIYNIGGNKMPPGGGRIDVNYVDTIIHRTYSAFADYEGGEPYIKVNLINWPDYDVSSIQIYNTPLNSFKFKEKWGYADTENSEYTRTWPYISEFTVNGNPAGQKQTVKLNQPINFKITLKDNSAKVQDRASYLYARPIIFLKKDQFLIGKKEFDPIKGDITNMDDSSSVGVWNLAFTPLEEGTYYYNVYVEAGVKVPTTTYEDGKLKYNADSWQADVTDQWDWIELDVKR